MDLDKSIRDFAKAQWETEGEEFKRELVRIALICCGSSKKLLVKWKKDYPERVEFLKQYLLENEDTVPEEDFEILRKLDTVYWEEIAQKDELEFGDAMEGIRKWLGEDYNELNDYVRNQVEILKVPFLIPKLEKYLKKKGFKLQM